MKPTEIWATDGSYATRPGHKVDILVDGEEAFAAIYDAIKQAKSYIYATFAYVDFDFRLRPDRPESLLGLLHERARNGVDVRAVIWHPGTKDVPGTVYDPGDQEIAGTNAGPGTIQFRWDKAKGRAPWPALIGCHHQKSFVIDGKVGFVGGINSTQPYWDTPAHDPLDTRRLPFNTPSAGHEQALVDNPPLHDVFSRFEGPCIIDVETNFVERWNGASNHHGGKTKPVAVHRGIGAATGDLKLQITRTIAPKTYKNTSKGETSIREIYLKAIAAAESLIYFEDQYYFDDEIDAAIKQATRRGVKVIGLLARTPDSGTHLGIMEQVMERANRLEIEAPSLFGEDNVELYCPVAAWADPGELGRHLYRDIYVHAKLMIVDDIFLTLGSANISFTSLDFHSEMNVVVNDAATASALRKRLWREHLDDQLLDERIFKDPITGFGLWKAHRQENCRAHLAKSKPRSRVFPFPFDLT